MPKSFDMDAIDAVGGGHDARVEDADRRRYDEKALFHLINLAREKRLFVLLTARAAPGRWTRSCPTSRRGLTALPSVEIGAPDEALLRTVMLKQFADRQLDIDPKVLEYLACISTVRSKLRRPRSRCGRSRGACDGPKDYPPAGQRTRSPRPGFDRIGMRVRRRAISCNASDTVLGL